jgi:hypothetical protein
MDEDSTFRFLLPKVVVVAGHAVHGPVRDGVGVAAVVVFEDVLLATSYES